MALPGEGRWQTVVASQGQAAVFNGGFRLGDPSHNGYSSEGRTVRPLVHGKTTRDGGDYPTWAGP